MRGGLSRNLGMSPWPACLRSALAFLLLLAPAAATGQEPVLGPFLNCLLGRECFVQQAPDVAPGPDIRDPACGAASYDGHDGWDIRLRSMPDIARDVAVIAARDGIVVGTRDGMVDAPVLSEAERREVLDRECGNGIVLAHGNGLVTQYCHLRQGSVAVGKGDSVRKGQRIGAIGSSGLAAFPHVHFSVRQGEARVEPLTGLPLDRAGDSCGNYAASLFDDATARALARPATAIIGAGLGYSAPDTSSLVRLGPPASAATGDDALLAWVWAINLEAGWRIRLRLTGPDARLIADYLSEPLATRKADYVAYAGHRRSPAAGRHRVEVQILDGDTEVMSDSYLFVTE